MKWIELILEGRWIEDIKTSFGPRRYILLQSLSSEKIFKPQLVEFNHPKEILEHVYQRSYQGSFSCPCRRRHGRSLCMLQCRTRQCRCSLHPSCLPLLFSRVCAWMLPSLIVQTRTGQKATCVRQCRGGSIYINCSASYVCSSPINNPETPRFWINGWISETD